MQQSCRHVVVLSDDTIQGPDNHEKAIIKKPRSSNFELYRIICMLMIVAHHYVFNSGVTANSHFVASPEGLNTLFLYLFGMWGKTGINCFLMITGYFMCKSRITLRKFLKLLLQVYFFKFLFYFLFLFIDYETISVTRIIKLLMPFWDFDKNFTSCFIAFYLTIPFLTILVQNMNKRQHQLLLLLSLGCYTVLGSIPGFHVTFNYITWFGCIFFIASYIRMYPSPIFERRKLWGWMTLLTVFLAIGSVISLQFLFGKWNQVLVADSNKVLAVAVSVCSFIWFKNLNICQSKIINAIGGSTFGVLLIHANSNAMRTWLWKDTIDVAGHFILPFGQLVLYSFGVVFLVFIICNLVDQLRAATIEKWFFNWYDKRVSARVDAFVNTILQLQ